MLQYFLSTHYYKCRPIKRFFYLNWIGTDQENKDSLNKNYLFKCEFHFKIYSMKINRKLIRGCRITAEKKKTG